MNRSYVKCLRIFFTLIVLYYLSNISFFTHTHIVDGVTIVHSHFHKRTQQKDGHNHTTAEFVQIVQLASCIISDDQPPVYLFGKNLPCLGKIYFSDSIQYLPACSKAVIRLRAPPELQLI